MVFSITFDRRFIQHITYFFLVCTSFAQAAEKRFFFDVLTKGNRYPYFFSASKDAALQFNTIKDAVKNIHDKSSIPLDISKNHVDSESAKINLVVLFDIAEKISKHQHPNVQFNNISIMTSLCLADYLDAAPPITNYIYDNIPSDQAITIYKQYKPYFFSNGTLPAWLANDAEILFIKAIDKLPNDTKKEEAKIWYPKQYTSDAFVQLERHMKETNKEQWLTGLKIFLSSIDTRICNAIGCGILTSEDVDTVDHPIRVDYMLKHKLFKSDYRHLPLATLLCSSDVISDEIRRTYDIDIQYLPTYRDVTISVPGDMPIPFNALSQLKSGRPHHITIEHPTATPYEGLIKKNNFFRLACTDMAKTYCLPPILWGVGCTIFLLGCGVYVEWRDAKAIPFLKTASLDIQHAISVLEPSLKPLLSPATNSWDVSIPKNAIAQAKTMINNIERAQWLPNVCWLVCGLGGLGMLGISPFVGAGLMIERYGWYRVKFLHTRWFERLLSSDCYACYLTVKKPTDTGS